jgi:hypothetical protein
MGLNFSPTNQERANTTYNLKESVKKPFYQKTATKNKQLNQNN